DDDARAARGERLDARRYEDVDLERRHRRFLCHLRQGRRRHQRIRRRREGGRRVGAHRHRGAASDGDRQVPRRARRARRRGRPRLQAGDAQSRHLPHHRRGRGARLRAPGARRGARPRSRAPDVRPEAGGLPVDAGEARRHGDRHRRRGAARLSFGLDQGCAQGARHARSGDGEDVRNRGGAAGDRRRSADLRRPRRHARPSGRAPLPRSAGATHLRRRHRSPETHHRPGAAEAMSYTAHLDTFVRDSLPPRNEWPEFLFEATELKYPARMNCATELLDKPVTRGYGHRIALRSPDGECTYTQLFTQTNRLANVLVREMGVKPGNRVLLRGANNPVMAACWLAVMKAGAVCVATMPLLRAKELTEIITKAEITHALCDKRLHSELETAAPNCPTLREVRYWYDDSANSLDNLALRQPLTFGNVATAADDPALIAFTSGTTGKPKGTVHFHRDVIAMCDCFPRSVMRMAKDDIVCGTPPIAFTFGLGGMLCFPLRYGASTVLVEKHTPETLLET